MQIWSYFCCYLSNTTEHGLILRLFHPMVSNASYLIWVFMNLNENIKITEKIVKNINILITGPNYHFFFIEPVISYDKFIEVVGLNKIISFAYS